MSFKYSSDTVLRNTAIWNKNIIKFEKSLKKRQKRGTMAESLQTLNRMPTNNLILMRYATLAETGKSRSQRVKTPCEEISAL